MITDGHGSVRPISQSAGQQGPRLFFDSTGLVAKFETGAKQMKKHAIRGTLAVLALAGACFFSGPVRGQNNNGGNNGGNNNGQNNQNNNGGGGFTAAGVVVSPDGVLKVKVFGDPTNTLVKKWAAD